MFRTYRRRRRLAKAEPGDGSPLPPYRLRQLFPRSLFALELADHTVEVDVRHLRDSSSSKRPVAFPVPGGVIEVAVTQYGLDRRFPRTSTTVGAVGLVVLLVGFAVTLSVAAERITRIEVVAQHLGTFVSPIHLPGWAKIARPAAGAVAAVDRALRRTSTWMADR